MVTEEYKTAYAEVLEILQKIPYIEYLKIPDDKLKVFETYADNKNNFKYDPNLTLDEQNVSETTKYIIAILYRDYWASPEEREQILKQQKISWQKTEDEKRKQFDTNNLFSSKRTISNPTIDASLPVSSSKHSVIKKIIIKIKKFFRLK